MTLHAPTHIAAATGPADLAAIRDPAVPAVIWRRNPPGRFLAWLEALSVDALPRMRTVVRTSEARAAVAEACTAARLPPGFERDLLVEDVATLAETIAGIVPAPHLRLRFDVIAGDGCTRFHVDRVAARLLCTYRGAGTELRHAGRLHSVLAGDVTVLRGTDWPGGGPGAEHRSPPRAPGGARLLLAIDPVFDPEGAA